VKNPDALRMEKRGFDTERSVRVGDKIHVQFLSSPEYASRISDVKELSRHCRRDLLRPVDSIRVGAPDWGYEWFRRAKREDPLFSVKKFSKVVGITFFSFFGCFGNNTSVSFQWRGGNAHNSVSLSVFHRNALNLGKEDVTFLNLGKFHGEFWFSLQKWDHFGVGRRRKCQRKRERFDPKP